MLPRLAQDWLALVGMGRASSSSWFQDQHSSQPPSAASIYPEGTEINYRDHVDIKNVDGSIVPWNASQSDLLATDWGTGHRVASITE